MEMMPHCLLCLSDTLRRLDEIPVSGLTKAYKRVYGYSPDQEFSGVRSLDYYLCTQCDLRFFWPPCTGSERFYRAFQRLPLYYLPDKFEYQAASPYVRSGDKVLEIGCGRGAFAAHLTTKDYTGLEFSPEAADSANSGGLSVLKQTIEEHAKDHLDRYDVVCAFQVLEHVADVNTFIAASVRALRPGGLLIFCVPSAESYVSRLTNALLNMPPHHVTHWSDAVLRNMLNLFPLELVSLQHEPLSDIQRHTYAFCVTSNALNKLLRRRHQMFDSSLTQLLLGKIAYRLAYLFSSGLNHTSLLPRGHSVIAVFRKPPRSGVEPCYRAIALQRPTGER